MQCTENFIYVVFHVLNCCGTCGCDVYSYEKVSEDVILIHL